MLWLFQRCGNAPAKSTRGKKKKSTGASSDRPSVKDYKFKNLLELWEVKAMRSLSQLRKLIVDGKVTVEVYHGVVKPLADRSGHGFVEFLAQHVQPYTVGWSNIIDYMRLDQV